jgi:hypothetical protein
MNRQTEEQRDGEEADKRKDSKKNRQREEWTEG